MEVSDISVSDLNKAILESGGKHITTFKEVNQSGTYKKEINLKKTSHGFVAIILFYKNKEFAGYKVMRDFEDEDLVSLYKDLKNQ